MIVIGKMLRKVKMKISELMIKLESIQKEHGDLEIFIMADHEFLGDVSVDDYFEWMEFKGKVLILT